MSSEVPATFLDLRAVFGIAARITTSAASTDGAYVEMDCTAEPGSATIIHYHPEQSETYEITDGVLEIFRDGKWHSLHAGETLTVPPGTVHGFRNRSQSPVRFLNRHEPARGFQAHLETLARLIRTGKIRGMKDPRSLVYMSMSAVTHRPDVAVRPPQRVVNMLAFVGRRLGYTLDE